MTGTQARVTIAKPARATTQPPASQKPNKPRPEANHAKAPASRLKLVIRRLPPGLTEQEFEVALGEEWRAGGTRVDWHRFVGGKISKDPAKLSRPGRAYLHLRTLEDANALPLKIKSTAFDDAKNTTKDSCLLGPPITEYALNGRVPTGKSRKDARQGTIDQDAEFIDFLESLTNPIAKPPAIDRESEASKAKEKVTTTPLVQFLKEKKANKGKDNAANAKNAKHSRQDSKDGKSQPTGSNKKGATPAASNTPKKRGGQETKADQTPRDNKSKAQVQSSAKTQPKSSSSPPPPKADIPKIVPNAVAGAALAEKKRERGSASAAVKMLQRDLLNANAGGKGSKDVKTANANQARTGKKKSQPADAEKPHVNGQKSQANTNASKSAPKLESSVPAPKDTSQASAGPSNPTALAFAQPNAATQPSTSSVKPRIVNVSTTQAFLKHANASSGMTESVIAERMAEFGVVKKVEMDRKKGFAYVDFVDSESLQKAIKSSPVQVAQGSVIVMERKSPNNASDGRNTRGAGKAGQGQTPVATQTSSAPSNRGSNARGGRGSGGRGGEGGKADQLAKAKTASTPVASASTTSAGASKPAEGAGVLVGPPP